MGHPEHINNGNESKERTPELQSSKERDVTPEQRKKNSTLRTLKESISHAAEVAVIAKKIDSIAGNPVATKVKSFLLENANLPKGRFTYSSDLFELVSRYGQILTKDIEVLDHLYGDERMQKLIEIAEKGEKYAEDIMQRFIRDNAPNEMYEQFKKRRLERIKDIYHTDLLTQQLGIVKALVQKQDDQAYLKSVSFVRQYFFGTTEDTKVSVQEQSMIQNIAGRHLAVVTEKLYPMLERQITEFAKRGFFKQFVGRAKSTVGFFADWVATPFSKSSRSRMSENLQPIAYMGLRGTAEKLYPILRDIAQIGWNVGINKGMALELLASCAGILTFDATLFAASFGAGAVFKGVQATEGVTNAVRVSAQALNGVRIGTGLTRAAVSPTRIIRPLTFTELESAQKKRS